MKSIKLFIILISSLNLFSQKDTTFFLIENSSVIWQKVYDTELNNEELINSFKENGNFIIKEVNNEKIIAELKQQKIDYSNTGIKQSGAPVIVTMNDYKGLVVIELKDKKYRITFKNIVLTTNPSYANQLKSSIVEKTFEETYLNKERTDFVKLFYNKANTIYNINFSEKFVLKITKQNKDW